MRVLHLVKTSVGAIWALRQMIELKKLGVDVHVAIPTDGPLIAQYQKEGIVVHKIHYSLKGIISSCKELRKIVNDVTPDIIHSHFVLTTLIMRIALRNSDICRIFQVPGPLHLENWFFRNIEILLAQKCDYWTGSCNWTNERYLKSGINKNRISLSYYGGYIPDSVKAGNKLRNELSLSKEAILIGMVAYIYAPKRFLGQKRGLKGHEDFIDAIAIVSKKYPNVYGICVGDAWDGAVNYENKVKEYAKRKTDNIIFCGRRNDVAEIYPEFACAVHPSHSENLGGAGESLMYGIPTIATNIGGFPDIVIDGETGILVKPKDVNSLALAIEKVIKESENAKIISLKGQKKVIEMLDIHNTALSMKNIYDKILK